MDIADSCDAWASVVWFRDGDRLSNIKEGAGFLGITIAEWELVWDIIEGGTNEVIIGGTPPVALGGLGEFNWFGVITMKDMSA